MMMNIYQHFRDDEQAFIDQVLDWVGQVEDYYSPYLTPFLNPREYFIIQSIVGQYDDLELSSFGGHEDAEQLRVFIHPPYFEPTKEDFEITLVEIKYPTKFAELSHGQIMGTVLGAGIVREALGDIITDGERWQFFIDSKLEKFLFLHVERVGRTNVQLEKLPLEEAIHSLDKWEEDEIIIASLRIDVVLAGSMNISRNRAKTLITESRIKLNWVEIERVDLEIEEHDILSIRGYGRIQIKQIKGTTRKDNLILEIGRIDRNK